MSATCTDRNAIIEECAMVCLERSNGAPRFSLTAAEAYQCYLTIRALKTPAPQDNPGGQHSWPKPVERDSLMARGEAASSARERAGTPADAGATPRTDDEKARVQEFSDYWNTDLVTADFARQLERELAETKHRAIVAERRLMEKIKAELEAARSAMGATDRTGD